MVMIVNQSKFLIRLIRNASILVMVKRHGLRVGPAMTISVDILDQIRARNDKPGQQ